MSIVASLIGSLSALFIAVFIFPWQKTIDRRSEYIKEKRALYREYVGAMADIFAEVRLRQMDPLVRAFGRHSNLSAQIILVADPEIQGKVKSLDSELLGIMWLAKADIEGTARPDYEQAFEKAICLYAEIAGIMRAEIEALQAKSPDLGAYMRLKFQRIYSRRSGSQGMNQ